MRHTGIHCAGARILITGAGSGIGRLLALGAASGGADVTVWDLSHERAQAVCDEIDARGGRVERDVVDVTDREAVAAAAERAGAIDVLVNNAGVVAGEWLLDASDEAIVRTFQVNALSNYWVTRAFLGGMVQRDHGMVVTIASAAALVGVAKQTDYSASKFAAFGFNESLRAELRSQGSHVQTLVACPYYINTGMFEGVRTRYPRLLPILDETRVAQRILDAIERGKRQLVMPPLVRLVPLARGALSVGMFDKLMDRLGVNATMDHFTGRAPVRQRTDA